MSMWGFLFCTLFCLVSSLICLSSAAALDGWIENENESKSGAATTFGFDLLELKTELLNVMRADSRELESRLEKLEQNSGMQSRLEKVEADLVRCTSKIEESSVPLGFVYIQLPNQYAPDVIWSQVTWIEVTKEYEGLFFRAEGGGSAAFGSTQDDSTRQITQVGYNRSKEDVYPDLVNVTKTGWSDIVYVSYRVNGSPGSQPYDGLRFSTSNVEVRPKNTAVRIWKRVL